MLKRTVIWIIVSITMVLTIFYSPDYLKKAIIYNFVGIDDYKLFENRTIENGKPIPWPYSTEYNQQNITGSPLDTLISYQTIAFVLIKNDSVLHETYWDNYNENSITNSFSMAKSIISLLIGIAIDEGAIKNIDQKVSDFIPDLKNRSGTELTIRHLLTMSSGSNWDESYSSPFSPTTKAYYGSDIMQLATTIQILETPGVEFKYQSGNTQLLALILETATKKSISEYASEKIWKKAGAVNPALWSLDTQNGTEKAYCCFNSNAKDFARIGAIVLHNGFFNQSQIVSKQYLDEMINANQQLIDSEDDQPVDFYGKHWWIINYKGEQIPYARGILGQYIFVLKKHNAILVRLGQNRSKAYINHHPSEIVTYLDLAMEMLNN